MSKTIKFFVIIIAFVGSLSVHAQGSRYIFQYGETKVDDSNYTSLQQNNEQSLISSYKKDSLRIPTRTIETPTGNYVYKLNNRVKKGILTTAAGTPVATISLDKENYYSLTTESGEVYSFKKISGNHWNFYSGNNPILVCEIKKVNRIRQLEFMAANNSLEGLESLIVISQLYGVDRIAAKKQSGIMWGTAIGLGIMNALISTSMQ